MRVGLWNNLNFQYKILLYVCLVCLVALGLAGAAMIGYETTSYQKGFMKEITAIGNITSQTCASAITFQDNEFATKILAGLEAEERIINACIYNTHNEIIATFRKNKASFVFPSQKELQEYEFPSGTLGLTLPVIFGNEQVGTIFIQAQTKELTERINIYIKGAMIVLLLSLAVALALASRLIKTITRPVVELQRTASLISRKNNCEARAQKFNNDELGKLTSDFNHMLDQIQQKDLALCSSEARFTTLLGRIDEVIFRLNMPDRTFEYCSPAALNMFGYSPEQLIEDPLLFRSIIHPECLSQLDAAYVRAASGELVAEFEFRILDRNNNEKWLIQTNSPVFDDDGNLTAIEGCCFNITDRVIAEKERTEFKSELAQTHRLEALGTLTGGIAHDFNNMLAAIMGNACLAKEELTEEHPAYEFISPILQASDRAKALVRQILTFARKDKPQRTPIPLADVITEALTLIRASLPSTISIKTQLQDNLSPIMADANQIHQVVMNLCTNSFHAMRERGGVLTLELNSITLKETGRFPAGSYLELKIRDTGEGISPDIQERMFEPFFTTKSKTEGTGMGLSVVFGIIRDHNGSITVDSKPGRGALFRILLPCIEKPVQSKAYDPEDLVTDTGRILFVDDEEMLVKMGCRILKKMGLQADGFSNPSLALAKFTENPYFYDLVITDFTMPNLTGMELARKINTQRSDLPIVIITGHQDLILSTEAAKYGVVHIATKPISFKSFSSIVHRALSRSRQKL